MLQIKDEVNSHSILSTLCLPEVPVPVTADIVAVDINITHGDCG